MNSAPLLDGAPLDVVSISDLTLDYILDPEGQPHLAVPGGKAVYTAVGLWLWSLHVGLAVDAGYDFDMDLLAPLAEAGVDVRGVQRNPHVATVCWAQRYLPDGERLPWNPHRHYAKSHAPPLPLDQLPDVDGFSPPQVVQAHQVDLAALPEDYHRAQGYHFAGREFLRQPEIVAAWLKRGARLTLDADWWEGPPLDPEASTATLDAALAPLAVFSAVLPSREDVQRLFGPDVDLAWAAQRLAETAQAHAAIKLGREGSLLYRLDRGELVHIPIVPVAAVDPTGAGDAYAGGFLAGLLRTGDPLEAACYGTVSASFVVEGYGAPYALTADREEAHRRLAWLRRRVGVMG